MRSWAFKEVVFVTASAIADPAFLKLSETPLIAPPDTLFEISPRATDTCSRADASPLIAVVVLPIASALAFSPATIAALRVLKSAEAFARLWRWASVNLPSAVIASATGLSPDGSPINSSITCSGMVFALFVLFVLFFNYSQPIIEPSKAVESRPVRKLVDPCRVPLQYYVDKLLIKSPALLIYYTPKRSPECIAFIAAIVSE